jgi:hypothetical protein
VNISDQNASSSPQLINAHPYNPQHHQMNSFPGSGMNSFQQPPNNINSKSFNSLQPITKGSGMFFNQQPEGMRSLPHSIGLPSSHSLIEMPGMQQPHQHHPPQMSGNFQQPGQDVRTLQMPSFNNNPPYHPHSPPHLNIQLNSMHQLNPSQISQIPLQQVNSGNQLNHPLHQPNQQLSQMNQMNQMTQMNQMSQMNPGGQVSQVNQVNQNQMNQMNILNQTQTHNTLNSRDNIGIPQHITQLSHTNPSTLSQITHQQSQNQPQTQQPSQQHSPQTQAQMQPQQTNMQMQTQVQNQPSQNASQTQAHSQTLTQAHLQPHSQQHTQQHTPQHNQPHTQPHTQPHVQSQPPLQNQTIQNPTMQNQSIQNQNMQNQNQGQNQSPQNIGLALNPSVVSAVNPVGPPGPVGSSNPPSVSGSQSQSISSANSVNTGNTANNLNVQNPLGVQTVSSGSPPPMLTGIYYDSNIDMSNLKFIDSSHPSAHHVSLPHSLNQHVSSASASAPVHANISTPSAITHIPQSMPLSNISVNPNPNQNQNVQREPVFEQTPAFEQPPRTYIHPISEQRTYESTQNRGYSFIYSKSFCLDVLPPDYLTTFPGSFEKRIPVLGLI